MAPPTTTTTIAEEEEEETDGRPDLLEGICEGTPSELSFIARAFVAILRMHHEGLPAATTDPIERLAARLEQLDSGDPIGFIDYDEPPDPEGTHPPIPNPDAAHIRELILATGRTTLIKALTTCVAVQRRMVTGTVYDTPVPDTVREEAKTNARVRWIAYRPVESREVEAIFHQARENDSPEHKKVIETHDMVRHWRKRVLPAVRAHYADA